jgi:hypothetical protein
MIAEFNKSSAVKMKDNKRNEDEEDKDDREETSIRDYILNKLENSIEIPMFFINKYSI